MLGLTDYFLLGRNFVVSVNTCFARIPILSLVVLIGKLVVEVKTDLLRVVQTHLVSLWLSWGDVVDYCVHIWARLGVHVLLLRQLRP
jgi:hypothetical protein